jgi:hypothetical protein
VAFLSNSGHELFPIAQALREARLSRATFYRWVQLGRIPDAQHRDRNGYRVFTREEIDYMRSVSNKTTVAALPRRTPLKFR